MSKAEQLVEMLREGWKTTEDIHLRFSWQNHTIRSVISSAAKKHNLRIERRREHGITSYRVAQ